MDQNAFIRRARARTAEAEAVAAQFPDDPYILANLKSLKRHAASLEGEKNETSTND